MDSELLIYIMKKVFGVFTKYPWQSLIALIILALIIMLISKEFGDRMEGHWQKWTLWAGIGVIIIIIVFFFLRSINTIIPLI